MADIFISYTNSDRDWAFWIGQELERLGHTARIHEWEIDAGGNIPAWMQERQNKADHTLCVVSEAYLSRPYSSWELQAAQWAAASERPNFMLPVFVEDCKAPLTLAPFKRCDLFGLNEDEARARLDAYLTPAAKPSESARFPGGENRTPFRHPEAAAFPGRQSASSNISTTIRADSPTKINKDVESGNADKNKKTLSWLGAGLVVVAGGAWAVFTFLWPHEAPSPEAPKIVCAEPGGVAAGRDASGNTITINGNAQVALGAKPCVEAGKAR